MSGHVRRQDLHFELCISAVRVGHYIIVLLVEYTNAEVYFSPSKAHPFSAVYCTILFSALSNRQAVSSNVSANYTLSFCLTTSSLSHIRIAHAATGPPSAVQAIVFTTNDIFEAIFCFPMDTFW
jgi:hypothetical protein